MLCLSACLSCTLHLLFCQTHASASCVYTDSLWLQTLCCDLQLIQRRCSRCSGSGLVERGPFLRKCPECGGFFPWQGWKRFLTSTATPGNGGVLRQPRNQDGVIYKYALQLSAYNMSVCCLCLLAVGVHQFCKIVCSAGYMFGDKGSYYDAVWPRIFLLVWLLQTSRIKQYATIHAGYHAK